MHGKLFYHKEAKNIHWEKTVSSKNGVGKWTNTSKRDWILAHTIHKNELKMD